MPEDVTAETLTELPAQAAEPAPQKFAGHDHVQRFKIDDNVKVIDQGSEHFGRTGQVADAHNNGDMFNAWYYTVIFDLPEPGSERAGRFPGTMLGPA